MIALGKKNDLYGMGNNHEQQLCNTQNRKIVELFQLPIKLEDGIDLICSNSFVAGLVSKPISLDFR